MELGSLAAEAWHPAGEEPRIGGVFACLDVPAAGSGRAGERGWAGAVVTRASRLLDAAVTEGVTGGDYKPGLLALRVGPLLEAAVRRLRERPEVLLVNASGRDHPRRAGLAVHLGARLDIPTVGVTHRPLLAEGAWPASARGSSSPLLVDGEVVGSWFRTQDGARPLAVHAGWRTDAETALEVVLVATARYRTPEPLRLARLAARQARANAG